MHIKEVDGQGGLPLSEAIKVDVCNNEAWWTAVGILENSLKVALNWDGGASQAMENWDLLV